MQEEGLGLAKRNTELEAAARKLRAGARDSEAEHQRLLSRVQNSKVQLAREQDRYAQASQAAGEQLLHSLCVTHSGTWSVTSVRLHVNHPSGCIQVQQLLRRCLMLQDNILDFFCDEQIP